MSRIARVLVAALAAATFAAAGVSAAVAAPRHPAVTLSPLELGVLSDINAFRTSHRLAALTLSQPLTAAARQHSQEMATDGYFAHESFDGGAFWKRIQRYYPSSAWGYWSVGENLLWSSPDVDAHGALAMWLNSPEHKANLMNPRWREIGVSAVHTSTAVGPYAGLEVTIVTTDFGIRK